MKKLLIFMSVLALTASCFGTQWFVSQSTGSKKGPGTREAPFKTIYDAVKAAQPGDVVFIASGTYTGPMGASEFIIDKPLTMVGSYAPDFSVRDLAKHTTLIQPLNAKNDTHGTSVIKLELPAGPGPAIVIDGLVVDQGFMNSYHTERGKPEGVETGEWLMPPNKGNNDVYASAMCYSIYAEAKNRFEGDIVVQNCLFANAGNMAVNLCKWQGNVKVVNNVFVSTRMEACDVSCSNANGLVACEFAYNSVLFTWSDDRTLSSMGYGFRCRERVAANIHHNFFGLNCTAGVGHDIGNPKAKHITLKNNAFFKNHRGDVSVTKSPSILYLKVGSDEFDDLEDYPGMDAVDGNVQLKDPFKGAEILHAAYLKGAVGAKYSEVVNVNDMTWEWTISMYANRYPLADCYKLFGAVADYGAQAVK